MKVRPLGALTSKMEPILEEMCDAHKMQHGEIMALVLDWLRKHRPGNIETFEDGTNPVYTYAHHDVFPLSKKYY